jgi:hypothetical protein
MLVKDVDSSDKSAAAWIQRVKNAAFGGLQADIFVVSEGAGRAQRAGRHLRGALVYGIFGR